MKEYKIVTDSASDLPIEFIKKHDLVVLPLKFHFNEETYYDYPDARDMKKEDYFKRLSEGEFSKTSQVTAFEYAEEFKKILSEGKDILVIALSGALSGTHNSALLAKEEVLEDYPNSKIMVVDSKSGSSGIALIVNEAIKLKAQNVELEEAYKKLDEFVYHVAHSITFDSLDYLKAGGRIGSVIYHVGSKLRLRPIVAADNDGNLKMRTNAFGRKKSLNSLIKRVVKGYDSNYGDEIYISHGDCLEEATLVKDEIIKETNAKVTIFMMGPVIGSHGGPGTIAVFYPAKER